MARSRLLILALIAAVVAGGILVLTLGGGDDGDRAPQPQFSATQPPSRAGTADAAIVESWASTLAAGRVRAAARAFALPAIVQADPSGPAVRLTRRAQVRAFNRSLPCGARMLEAVPHGRYTIATFRLVERPGATCDGPGGTATAAFLVRDGLIVEWRRVPDVAAPGAGAAGDPVALLEAGAVVDRGVSADGVRWIQRAAVSARGLNVLMDLDGPWTDWGGGVAASRPAQVLLVDHAAGFGPDGDEAYVAGLAPRRTRHLVIGFPDDRSQTTVAHPARRRALRREPGLRRWRFFAVFTSPAAEPESVRALDERGEVIARWPARRAAAR